MRCPYCNKVVFPWHRTCAYCGERLDKTFVEIRNEIVTRWKDLNSRFEYTPENIEKISRFNDILAAKSKKLLDDLSNDIRPLLLRLQNEGFEDFFEFKIHGWLYISSEKETPYADSEMLEKIDDATSFRNMPQLEIRVDYNDYDIHEKTRDYEEFLKPVPHRGVFANPAFDDLKLCRAMDITFNQQKGYTLFDALYLEESDVLVQYEINTSKHLWRKDKKLQNKKFLFCPICHRPTMPGAKYCTRCGDFSLAKNYLIKKSWKYRLSEKNRWGNFDWNYENKMKVYALNDYVTELFYHIYDESFRLQKIFNQLKDEGKTEFSGFDICGYIKYLNRNPTPRLNKKWARILNEATNTNYALHGSGIVRKDSVWNEDDREYNNYLGGKGDHLSWNIECFDRSYVGNRDICYFMHSLFADGDIYALQDIPYMDPKDFVVQFEITLCDDPEW